MRRTALFGSVGWQILRRVAGGRGRVLPGGSDRADRGGLDPAHQAVLGHLIDVDAELLL